MHDLAGGLVLGYHGCDREVAEALLAGEPFIPSDNSWDWLGPGIYFWEANPKRGIDFARDLQSRKRGSIREPAVVGAVINPGLCLDTSSASGLQIVRDAYQQFAQLSAAGQQPTPRNSKDLRRRDLDCAVMKLAHRVRQEQNLPAADSVRGVFVEGDPIYENAGFREKTHVQLAVRNPDCIKGVFRVPSRFLE